VLVLVVLLVLGAKPPNRGRERERRRGHKGGSWVGRPLSPRLRWRENGDMPPHCPKARQEFAALARARGALRLLRRPAAVDEEISAGDVAGIFGAEIDSQLSDFFLLTPAAQRDFGDELPVQFGILE